MIGKGINATVLQERLFLCRCLLLCQLPLEAMKPSFDAARHFDGSNFCSNASTTLVEAANFDDPDRAIEHRAQCVHFIGSQPAFANTVQQRGEASAQIIGGLNGCYLRTGQIRSSAIRRQVTSPASANSNSFCVSCSA